MNAEKPPLEDTPHQSFKNTRGKDQLTPTQPPTCQETAPSTTVDSTLKSTRRSEMRQKWRMPLEAMTWSRLRPPERCARHAFWQSLSLVWKPHTVMSRTTWHTDQKRPKRQNPGITRYHSSRSPSWRKEAERREINGRLVFELQVWR